MLIYFIYLERAFAPDINPIHTPVIHSIYSNVNIMISFKLSKKSDTRQKQPTVKNTNTEFSLDQSEHIDDKQKIEWISSEQNANNLSKGKLVIPLPDEFKIQSATKEHKSIQFISNESTLLDQAKQYGLVKPTNPINRDPLLNISRSKRYSNEHSAYMHDISILPSTVDSNDYVKVPVEKYGEALLRGMGWKDGEAISPHGPKEPLLPKARAIGRLGLGADPEKIILPRKK